MKIRNGFVSNSSTSSFIVLGISLLDAEKAEIKFPDPEDNYEIIVFGEGNEGLNLICCQDAAMLNYCKKHLADGHWMKSYVSGRDGIGNVERDKLPEYFDAEFGECEEGSSESVEDLIERYGPDGAVAGDYEPKYTPSGEIVCVKKRKGT